MNKGPDHEVQSQLEHNEHHVMCKEMWDKLQVIYEGTSEVRETKTNMLVSEYEAFHMKNNESISKMYAILTLITNGLKSLGKTYSEYELIKKILRSLTSV